MSRLTITFEFSEYEDVHFCKAFAARNDSPAIAKEIAKCHNESKVVAFQKTLEELIRASKYHSLLPDYCRDES